MAVQRHHIPRLSDSHNDVPPELDAIIARALATHRADRYATAREMGQALTRLFALRGDAVSVPELSTLMGRLFERRKKSQRNLVRSALSSPTPPSHRLFPKLRPRDEDVEASASGIVQRRDRTRLERPRRQQRTSTWKSGLTAFLIAFLATTLVGGTYLMLRSSSAPPPERTILPH
jgi:hypothetical protein